ncbi:MAG: hypothetical protein M1837_006596 [Sclerophora amabilis]|nr:MAG: hypothetical protein M1837_006596 [Sclerophora amabilis]
MSAKHFSEFSPPHILEPIAPHQHTHTIIILLGRGSNGPEFAAELFEEQSSAGLPLRQHFPGLKWIFPTARKQFSTVFQEEMTEWFQVESLTDPSKREETQVEGLLQSTEFVLKLIQSEMEFVVSPNRLILAGISQGCATSIHALLAGSVTLGAYIGWSGWMPFRTQIEALSSAESESYLQSRLISFYESFLHLHHPQRTAASSVKQIFHTPVFLGYATDDDVVDVLLGRQMCRALEKLRINVLWREYDKCGHWIKEPAGVDDVIAFLQCNVEAMIDDTQAASRPDLPVSA